MRGTPAQGVPAQGLILLIITYIVMLLKLCTPHPFWLKTVVWPLVKFAYSSPAQGRPVQGYIICSHTTMNFAIELLSLFIVTIIHVGAAIRNRVRLCVQWDEHLLTIQWLKPIHCSVCNEWLNGQKQWDEHLVTYKHIQRIRRLQRKTRAQEAYEEWQRSDANRLRCEK